MAIKPGLWLLAISALAIACGDDSDKGGQVGAAGATVANGDSGKGAAGAGAGATSGSGTQTGASGRGASSGSAGSGAGRNGGRAGASGSSAGNDGGGDSGSGGGSAAGTGSEPNPTCDLDCEQDQRCVLIDVQCFRAPCPQQPMCVPAADEGQACGSRGQAQCPAGQYCQLTAGTNCGAADQGGRCTDRPTACTRIYQPVCGCDGKPYGNACEAAAAGVSVASEGECGTRAEVDCNHNRVACDAAEPPCDQGEVASVNDSCYGPCVTVNRCTCDGPSDCPHSEQYTCHMSAGHCGPYV